MSSSARFPEIRVRRAAKLFNPGTCIPGIHMVEIPTPHDRPGPGGRPLKP